MQNIFKIAVTGATGFIGQHLLEDITPGEFSLRVITRKASKPMRVLPAGCEVVEADLFNLHSLTKAFEGIDVVINIAAEVRNPTMLVQTNIEGVKNLINAALEKGVKKIIHLSSAGVVGMQYSSESHIVDEEAECLPKIAYERTKLKSEKLLIEASKKYNFKLNILRPTNVFGEYHPFNALLNFMQYISNDKPMVCTSDAMVNYVYVKDLTALILQLVNDDKEYGILNVGSSSSLIDFSSLISQSLNRKSKKIILPAAFVKLVHLFGIRKFNSVSNKVEYSDKKLKTFFNYPYGLKNGLERIAKFYNQKELIR